MSQTSFRPNLTQIRKLESPVVGFRLWHIARPEGAERLGLWPLNLPYGEWNHGVNKAVCRNELTVGHRPAEPGCGCGFWIKNSLDAARGYLKHSCYVLGVVTGWGRVQIHLDGWRCEYAMPLAFAYVEGMHRTAHATNTMTLMLDAAREIAVGFDVPLLMSLEDLQRWHENNTEK